MSQQQIAEYRTVFQQICTKSVIHRVVNLGMIDCNAELYNHKLIKLEIPGKPVQQIRISSIKNIRQTQVNILGIEMFCFDLYLDNAKNAVFACDNRQ